jgi:DNA-binding PadR family transcriptional regulator
MLLYSGRLASLRGRKERFWASQAQKVYEQLTKRRISWGALLPALRRLEESAYLSADWTADDARRPIRYYSLTVKGKAEAASVQAPSLAAAARALGRPELEAKW